MREHRFGASPPLTIGVEEELLLVDAGCGLVAEAERLLEAIDPGRRAAVSTEIFATQIELKTGVCLDAAAGGGASWPRCGAAVAADRRPADGLRPLSRRRAASRRWSRRPATTPVKEDLASLLSTPPCGLHVHVGMPDPETAVAGRQRDAPPPAAAGGADRQLALPRRRRHRPWRAPAPASSAATRASRCRAPSATTRSSSASPTS